MLLIPPFKSINTEEENFPCDGNHVSFQEGLTVLQKNKISEKILFYSKQAQTPTSENVPILHGTTTTSYRKYRNLALHKSFS